MAPPKKLPSNRPMPSTHRRAPQKPGEPALPAPPPAMPSTHRAKPPAQLALVDDGNRYRVRDKDFLKVHGEDLSKADAEKLKLEVTTSGKSRTARLEPMAAPTPATDPRLAELQGAAIAAAAKAAADANARVEARNRIFKHEALPEEDDLALADGLAVAGDIDDVEIDEGDVDDLLGEVEALPTPEDIAHVERHATPTGADDARHRIDMETL